MPRRVPRILALTRAAVACTLLAMVACDAVPQRFDSQPSPLSTTALVGLGLREQPEAWSCIDAAHDDYLRDWAAVIAQDAAALAERIRTLDNPLEGGVARGSGDHWMRDEETVRSFARRHASTLRRLESLDGQLLSAWSACLGPAWSERLDVMRVDRGIERWRAVAEGDGPAILDLRMMIPRAAVAAEEAANIRESLLTYARELEPLVKRLADARLQAPLEAIRLRREQEAATGKVDERAVVNQLQASLRVTRDAILRLDLATLDRLAGGLPEATLARLREAVVDAADRGRPRYGKELLAPVAAELPGIDAKTRRAVLEAIEAHRAEDARLLERLASLLRKDPASQEVKAVRDARTGALEALNRRVLEALPEPVRKAMAPMQGAGVRGIRRTIESVLDPAVASRFDRELPPPEPEFPDRRLPLRKPKETLAQLLPPDFGTWATTRLPGLAGGDEAKEAVVEPMIREVSERWSRELDDSLERLKPMQQAIEGGLRDPITLAEFQRRVRTAVAELDAARARLQLIEDPLLAEVAAVAGLPMSDPAVERLRLERASEFAGLSWSELPVHTLFRLDREATIDLPTLFDRVEMDEGGRAIADLALADNAVPIIELSESLRQACVQSLRSLVLEIKRLQLQGVADKDMASGIGRQIRGGSGSVRVAAENRVELQRRLLEQVCLALPAGQARELRRSYWETAFPELFVERRPWDRLAERLQTGLRDGGPLQAAADGVLESRARALDALIPEMVAARKLWSTDLLGGGGSAISTMAREAPTLATLLRVREEIDARALRSLASLDGSDEAWETLAEWGRERPAAFDGL